METQTSTEIAVYDDFRAQLDQFKAENEGLTFDYASAKGNKEARSHIHKLRRTKGAIEKTRKAAKADALEYGRKVDAKARELTAEVDEMIEVHAVPIRAIEEAEEARVAEIERRIDMLAACCNVSVCETVADVIKRLDWLEKFDFSDLDEFEEKAKQIHESATTKCRERQAEIEQRDKERAELERLRREREEQEAREREERIAKEAAERARREAEEALERQKREAEEKLQREREEAERQRQEAEAAAERERQEAKRRELELKLEAERADRERAEAEKRAEQAAREAERRLQREAEEKAERLRIEQERREADERHRQQVLAEICEALTSHGLSKTAADDLSQLMAAGEIPHVTVNF